MNTESMKFIPGEPKDLHIQALLVNQRSNPVPPMQLKSMLPTSHDKTIAQVKQLLKSGKSFKVVNNINQTIMIVTLLVPPPIANHLNQMTFDLTKSLLQDIKSQYIRRKVVELLSPIKREQFRYALKVFVTDNEFIDVMNNDIIKQIRPYSKTPKKYRLMNLFHILYTGLQNEDIIEILGDSDFELECTVEFRGKTYKNVNLLMAEMNFDKIMKNPAEDLPDIKIVDRATNLYLIDTMFVEPWENFVKFYARRYKITILPILYDRQGEKEMKFPINENFIDLRVACQINDAFYRIL